MKTVDTIHRRICFTGGEEALLDCKTVEIRYKAILYRDIGGSLSSRAQ